MRGIFQAKKNLADITWMEKSQYPSHICFYISDPEQSILSDTYQNHTITVLINMDMSLQLVEDLK